MGRAAYTERLHLLCLHMWDKHDGLINKTAPNSMEFDDEPPHSTAGTVRNRGSLLTDAADGVEGSTGNGDGTCRAQPTVGRRMRRMRPKLRPATTTVRAGHNPPRKPLKALSKVAISTVSSL